MSFSLSPACPSMPASIRSAMQGTRTSARFMAETSSGLLIGVSLSLSSTSNSSFIRVSTASGNRRVTTTLNRSPGIRRIPSLVFRLGT
jgi:hypothetical protein